MAMWFCYRDVCLFLYDLLGHLWLKYRLGELVLRTTICTRDCYITSQPTQSCSSKLSLLSAILHVILAEWLVTVISKPRYCWVGYNYSRYLPCLQLGINFSTTKHDFVLLLLRRTFGLIICLLVGFSNTKSPAIFWQLILCGTLIVCWGDYL